MTLCPEIYGHCDERFALVREAFATNFTYADEVGASFALTVDGELVVDIWGGHADAAKSKAWQRDTLVNVYSTTKTMTALCVLVLADRGVIDLDAPVSRYWPEFAQNGKRAIEVRHLLSHSAGLPGLDVQVAEADVYDWDRMTTLLAAQRAWWAPGTQSGYHPVTQGHLIGEVVRRTTGMTLGTFFRREIAEPLDADFHIGLDPRHFVRVGELIPPPDDEWSVPGDPDSISERAFSSPRISALASRTTAWRTAEIPAANGHGNARSVAKVQTLLANGGSAFGKRILSARGCERVFEEQTNGIDLVLGIPVRFGLGYALSPEFLGFNPRTCYWGGWRLAGGRRSGCAGLLRLRDEQDEQPNHRRPAWTRARGGGLPVARGLNCAVAITEPCARDEQWRKTWRLKRKGASRHSRAQHRFQSGLSDAGGRLPLRGAVGLARTMSPALQQLIGFRSFHQFRPHGGSLWQYDFEELADHLKL